MPEAVCSGCGGVIDFSGIEPFTVCECSECGTELVIPLELEYLKLERSLGRKLFFDVYQGFDKSNNINSIVYVMDGSDREAKDFLSLAKEEASSLSTLKHVNICPMVNSGEVAGKFFISEPLMDGSSLTDFLPDEGEMLEIDKVVDVLHSALIGLAVAHHKEFPHHDICPENMHIDARGNVRVKNFFISRFVAGYESSKGLRKSLVSPYYISPERAEHGTEDKRGDVFSLGVLLFFMLTGKYPFQGRNDIETIYSRVFKKEKATEEVFNSTTHRMITPETVSYVPPPPPQNLRPDINPRLGNLILRMLDPQPFKRPTLPEALDTVSLYKAQAQQERELLSAQSSMVRMDYSTRTRALPKMGNLGAKKEPSKKRRFFL